jgi:HAD superfamily hydrolase (TIGR01509 family)
MTAPDATGVSAARSATELRGVLFDMDGLLVDTEPHWFAAETATSQWLGHAWTTQDQHALLGSNLPFAADYMLRVSGADVSRAEVVARLRDEMTARLRDGDVVVRPGARELLGALRAAAVPVGLVTSSVRVHVDPILDRLTDVPFDAVVTADDVERKKPDPQPYLLGLQRLGTPAAATVALEDSPRGVASAEAAGCVVVAVPNVVELAPSPGRVIVSSLTELDLTALRRLVATRPTG